MSVWPLQFELTEVQPSLEIKFREHPEDLN